MEHSEQALATARELMKLLADNENAEQTLHRIADLACRVVPPARMAGISLLADGRWSTPVCTDPTVAKVDKSQYVADSGPCVDSARASEVRRMDSADSERRWPEFAKAASVAGIKSTISFPLSIDGKTTGALNLYSREENAFTEEQERTGLLFA